MAIWPKLQGILSEDEIQSIPENLRSKLDTHILNLQQVVDDLKNENAEIVAISERQQFQFEKEIFESQSQLKESAESAIKSKALVSELEANLTTVKKELRENQSTFNSANLELQSSKRSNELLLQEKRLLVDQLEKRRNNIEKLNGEVQDLLQQTTAANEEKHAAIAKAEEAQMHESKFQHQVNRLEQEKALLEQQIADFNIELAQKNHEIHSLKREKSTIVLELQSQLEHRSDEVYMLEKQVSLVKDSSDEKDNRIEMLAEKIHSIEDRSLQIEQQFNIELEAKTKLVALYEKASEDNQNRVKELVSAFEQAQKVLQELSEARSEAEKNCEMIEEEYKLKLQEVGEENHKLKEELKHANDLYQGKIFNAESLESMFPTAAATSKVLRSGMTLTQLYSEYIKSQELVQSLKEENHRLKEQLKQIMGEIEENTPVITERMKEYHKSLDTVSCLRTQLSSALTDYEIMSSEKHDMQRGMNKMERENHRLKSQVSDLNHQVQVLLKQVEESQGSYVKLGSPRQTEDVTSSDDVTADKVISRHLVTFRDIVELQTKNQQLLAVVRQLSEDQEEQEKKLTDEKVTELKGELDKVSSQLEDLQKNRLQQAELIQSVIGQRDMFRVLLTHHGVNESLLGSSQGGSLLNVSKMYSPSDRTDANAKSALQQLQSEFDNYKKEKAENERLLTVQLDKARSDTSDSRVEVAKLTSKLEYCDERTGILNANMEGYKKEVAFLREKNQKHTTLITQHQQAIQSLKHELMIAHEKIAKQEVMVENLRAEKEMLKNIEKRLLHEKESIFHEQQQKSQVLANLQALQNNLERIESESKRSMQYQIEKYEKENNMLKARLDSANEDYRSAVVVWEKQNKELQLKIDSEVEKNSKLHEDLVDAYSRVHAINQELSAAKAAAGPAGANTDKSASPNIASKTESQNASNLKNLKEQLHESQARSKALQEQLDISRKSADHYMKMCNDLELRVKEQDEVNTHLKSSMESALQAKEDAKRQLEQNVEDLEKRNRGLIEENMKLCENRDVKVQELIAQLSALQKEISSNQNGLETATKMATQAREDCLAQKKLMEETQEKYERELLLHAEDVQALTLLKEDHQKCNHQISELTSAAHKAEESLSEHKSSWSERETMLLAEQESLRARVKELEVQNNNLMQQLELMGTQMKALKSANVPDMPNISPDLKDTEHLLEIIQFIKKEKEIASTQYDAAQSESVRLKLKVEQLTTDLNESKTELKELQDSAQVKVISETQHSELLRKIEMLNLLTESNSLLRIEKDSLLKTKEELDAKVTELQKQVKPIQDMNKDMKSQLELLSDENEALRSEVRSWQSRTNQLLEQSHRIGPQEYKNLTREMEELKNQKVRLAEELQKKQSEVSSVNSTLQSVKKELEMAVKEYKNGLSQIEKLTLEIGEQQKTMLQVKKIGRKYKTQYDELKVMHDSLVAKTKVLENAAQDHTVQEMQRKLQDGEKAIKELKEESDKQKENALKTKKDFDVVQKQALEKDEKTRKLLAQAKQRINQINTQKNLVLSELEQMKNENTQLKSASGEDSSRFVALKAQYDGKIALLEADLKAARENGDFLKKQCDELCQKMALQQKQVSKPTAVGGIVERGSSEPLTANIKPLSPAQASGSGLRHTPIASQSPRSTPTASIRPMAIGPVPTASSSQARMAAVLPTAAATPVMPSTSDDDVNIVAPMAASPVPQATVQPTPAMATVAPTTVASTITPSSHTPVISELTQTAAVAIEPQSSQVPVEPVQNIHIASASCVTTHATALISPRVEGIEAPEPVPIEGPAPTTSVIVSPPATQTQLVTPTIKRKLEDSPGSSDSPDSSLNMQKRVRMISEGSQTNQQSSAATTLTVTAAVVPVATVVSRAKVEVPTSEVAPSMHHEPAELQPTTVVTASVQPSTSRAEIPSDDKSGRADDKSDDEIIDVEDKDDQTADWEAQDDVKTDGDFEVMEEEDAAEHMEEFDDDVDQVPTPSGEVEDIVDEPSDNLIIEPPSEVPNEIFDVLDGGSDTQMEADNSNLQVPSGDQSMAPPASPMTQVTEAADTVPDTVIEPLSQSRRVSRPPRFPMRQDRMPPVSRQHLTPFTIQGQGPGFEDSDDSIVPSTPTLIAPRRPDGFAEAINSPHVPHVRFSFGSTESSPTQQVLSQLESQGALRVDDTRMDLSQFDEGGGRTVPSTPLQVSPPDDGSLSVVPEIIEPADVEQTGDSTVPTIRIESVESLASQSAEKVESSQLSSAERDPVPSSSQTRSEASKPISGEGQSGASSACAAEESDGSEKKPEGGEGESSSQVPAPQTVRKPIVWKEESGSPSAGPSAAAPASSNSSVAAASQFSQPAPSNETGSRSVRPRRMRYRGATNFARGAPNWPQRRGRSTARRSRMF